MLSGKTLRDKDSDVEFVSFIVVCLRDRTALISGISSAKPVLSEPAREFGERLRKKSAKELLDVRSIVFKV